MVEGNRHGVGGYNAWSPISSTPGINMQSREDPQDWRHYDNSVNAVSFGFVATAILISMFLVMAIFERFLRPNSSRNHGDIESHIAFNNKLGHSSPKMTVYANGVSVLMPGDNIPTFIAHPAPVPCHPGRSYSPHQHEIESRTKAASNSVENPTSSSTSISMQES